MNEAGTLEWLLLTGRLLFETEKPAPERIAAFCQTPENEFFGSFFFYFMPDAIPEPERGIFRKRYLDAVVDAMRMETALSELYGTLESAQIRFAPFKGADLAFRIYPSPALRFFTDWDLLFHPDDCTRALDVLARNGWFTANEFVFLPRHHHFPRRYKCADPAGHEKGGRNVLDPDAGSEILQLEPHRTLPRFEGIDPHELWAHIRPYQGSRYRHILSPELNLLMTTRHAAAKSYMHTSLPKLLTDAGFLLKNDPPDWSKLRKMTDVWHLPRPEHLLGAWPEFFPPELYAQMETDRIAGEAYRTIFQHQMEFCGYQSADWAMNRPDVFTREWMDERLSVFHLKNICAKHHLGKSASALRISCAYVQEAVEKLTGFSRRLFCPNPAIRTRNRLIGQAESRSFHP